MQAAQKIALGSKEEADKRKEKERKREEKELRKIAKAAGVKVAKPTTTSSLATQEPSADATPPVSKKSGWATFSPSLSDSSGPKQSGWASTDPSASTGRSWSSVDSPQPPPLLLRKLGLLLPIPTLAQHLHSEQAGGLLSKRQEHRHNLTYGQLHSYPPPKLRPPRGVAVGGLRFPILQAPCCRRLTLYPQEPLRNLHVTLLTTSRSRRLHEQKSKNPPGLVGNSSAQVALDDDKAMMFSRTEGIKIAHSSLQFCKPDCLWTRNERQEEVV